MNVLSNTELLLIYAERYPWDLESFQEFVDTFGVYSRDSVEYALAEYKKKTKGDRVWLQDLRVILFNHVEEMVIEDTVNERDKLAYNRDWYELQAKIMEGRVEKEKIIKQYRKKAKDIRKKLSELED